MDPSLPHVEGMQAGSAICAMHVCTHLTVVTAEEGERHIQLVDHGDEQHGVTDAEGAVRNAVHTHYHAADLCSRGL